MGAKVAVIMGSKSDWPCMQEATQIMDRLGVSYEVAVVSAHRTRQTNSWSFPPKLRAAVFR